MNEGKDIAEQRPVRDALLHGAVNCPHVITDDSVILFHDPKQSGANALAQLGDRLASAVSQTGARSDVPANVGLSRDQIHKAYELLAGLGKGEGLPRSLNDVSMDIHDWLCGPVRELVGILDSVKVAQSDPSHASVQMRRTADQGADAVQAGTQLNVAVVDDTDELLAKLAEPCPFCGDSVGALDASDEGGLRGPGLDQVTCECGASGPGRKTRAEALAAWNCRAAWQQDAAQPGERVASEPMVRFCPQCGLIGDPGEQYRDCCPDGSHARVVPKKFAEDCQQLFRLVVDGVKSESGQRAGVAEDFLRICEDEVTRSSLVSLPLKLDFARAHDLEGLHAVHAWMVEAHRKFTTAVKALRAASTTQQQEGTR